MDVTELEMAMGAIQDLRSGLDVQLAAIRATQAEQGKMLAVAVDKSHAAGDCPSMKALMRDVRFAKGALWALGLLAVPTLGGVILLALDWLNS